MNDIATQKPKLNVPFRVGQLRKLLVIKAEIEARHKKELEPLISAEKALRAALLEHLIFTGVKTMNTENGNITKVDKTTFPIEDQIAFSRHVIGTQAWELLDWKANVTAVKDYINENNALPPGLKANPWPYLQVKAPTKKDVRITQTGNTDIEVGDEEE